MARSRPTARRPLGTLVPLLAGSLLAAIGSGCAVKSPPDAAAIREQALPGFQPPAGWTTAGAGAGAVMDNWLDTFKDHELTLAVYEAIGRNTDLQVAATRVEQAQLYAKLAGAKLYPTVDVLARGGGEARASRHRGHQCPRLMLCLMMM